jgi:hypothetical protein
MENNWIIIKDENDYPIVEDSHYWVEKPSGEITINFFKDSFYSPHFTKVNVAYMLIDEPSPRIKKEDKVDDFHYIKPGLREIYLKNKKDGK